MSVNEKCRFSPKFIPLVKTWAQTKTDPEFLELLDQFFENSEDVYNQFKITIDTPIGTVVGNTSPNTEPEISPVEVIEKSKPDARVVTTTDTISGLYVGRTEARKKMLRRFKKEMLERSRMKILNDGSVVKVEPNVSTLSNGVTKINQNIYEYKIDLINIILKKIKPDSDSIAYDYDLSNEEFTALMNKVLQTNIELNDAEWDAYVILSKFDDLIEQEVPFIKIRSAFSKADYRVEGINKYEYVGSKVNHDSSWSTNEFSDSMHQASALSSVILDYLPECDSLGTPIEGSSITLSGFYSCMTAMRDALLYYPTGALIEARKEMKKGDKADMSKMIGAYLQYLKTYKEHSVSQYYNPHISYLIGKLEGIKKYIFESDLDSELKSVFRQMFVKNVRMKYMGYSYDYTSEKIEGKDLQSSPINTQTYSLLDTMASAIYRFRTQSSSALENAFKNCKVTYKRGFNGSFTLFRGDNKIIFANNGVKWDGNSDELSNILVNIFEELTGYSLPEDFEITFEQVNPSVNYTSVLGRAISIIVNATDNGNLYSSHHFKSTGYPSELKRVEFSTVAPIGKALSIVYGSNTANVVKNINRKKNLPLFGLNSLAYNFHSIMWQHMDNVSPKNIYKDSYLFESGDGSTFVPSLVLSPSVRSEIEINGKLKSVDQLSVSEVIRLAIFSDFYRNVTDENKESIALQNTTFADKNTHFLINYRLDQEVPGTGFTLRQMIKAYLSPTKDNVSARRILENVMYNTRSNRALALINNIVTDYNVVFNTNFQTLKEVNDWIVKHNYTSEKIRSEFAKANVTAYEELHYCLKGNVINKQILDSEIVFSRKENFDKILEKQKKNFVVDLLESGFSINAFVEREGKDLASKYSEWFNEDGTMILAKDPNGEYAKIHSFNAEKILDIPEITLNPILESFFMADNFLSHEYNELMIGGEYCHPGKDEASRLIAQIKRSVIFGATQHSFVQGLANGVASEIKMAVMPDMPADTRNIVGDEDLNFKSMDGSAECTMLQARLESNSLLDARSKGLGYDKKNIGHDIDSEYGRPTLLKFAVYAMTNARRRASFKSKASQDRLLKRMYSAGEITIDVDTLNRYLAEHPVYFETTEDGIHYCEVVGFVQNPDGTISRQIMECDNRGNNFGTVRTEPGIKMNTLWSIDQAFGGAFTMSMVDGKLKYSETNNDVLEQFVTENPKAKDCQIAYLVNKSAIKVGAGNVNSLDSWFNADELKTITMHTRYMGVQMDAEHDLDHAEVTEMTQLISALSQSGFTSHLVNDIYTTIGEVIDEALIDYKGAIDKYLKAKYQGDVEQAEKEKLKIYNLLGKVFIESFESGDRDTIGLAQAFVLKASKALKNGDIDYRLPFSADTVSGIFISTVSSLINKRGIKRKYDGFAGVLSPAYNQIQFYRVGGKAYMYRKFAELVSDMGITGYTKPNLLTIDQGPQQKLWARSAHNGYEVSKANGGDSRFSAFNAVFKPGTILFGHDVSGRTIESVYQHGVKQGDWTTNNNQKTGAPKDKTIITGNTENDSYYQGYLPLWQEWARQNPELIEELRVRSQGRTLTDQYASSQANQARALAEILTKTESVQRGPLKLYRGYASNSTTPVSIKNVTKTAAVGLDDTSTDYIGQGLHFTSSKETAEEYARIHTEEFYPEYSERAGQRQKGFGGKYTHVMEVYIDTTNAKIGYYEDINDYRRNSIGDEDIVVLKTDTLGHNDFEVKLAPGQEWRLVESPYISAVDAAMNDYIINGRPNPFLKKIGQNEIDFEDTIVIREPDGEGGSKFTEVYVNSRAKYYDLKRTVRPNAVYYRFESKPRNLKGPNTKFEVNGKTYSAHDLDSVYAIEQMQQNPEKVEILPRTLSYEGKIKYAEEKGWIYTLRRHDTNKHFGNPFAVIPSEVQNGRASMLVRNVKIAAEMYEAWLRGDEYYELDGKAVDLRNIETERRKWIVEQFETGTLIGKKFAYYTEAIPDNSWVDENGEVIKKYDYHKAPNHAHILMKLAHEWMADKVLAKMEETPFISDDFKTEKSIEKADLETWKTAAEFYSGAADGSDQAWGKYLRELGLNVKDFTIGDYDALSQLEKGRIEETYKSIANYLNRPILSATSNGGKYVRRDMLQAEAADAIFAIGTLLSNGYPDGGTAYAVTRAMGEKPIYFYDLNKHSWFTYDVSLGWVNYNGVPTLTPHAAVIGTRDDETITGIKNGPDRLRPEGHEAIKAVIKQTFGEQKPSPVEEIQEGRLSTEGYYYNAQQVAAIDGVSDIIKRTMANPAGGPSFVTIQGMAGTGKTSIINAILEKVVEDQHGYVTPIVEISAVSHKAKSVLFSKISKSVHSKFNVKAHSLAGLLGKGFNVETGEYEKGQSEKVSPIEEARIVFVDEASMLNEEDLNGIYEGVNKRNVTIVFIGDIGQINPIRNSPFFRNLNIASDAPSPIFTTSNIPIFRLTERVRQGEDSPVLAYADKYYQFNTGQTAQYPNEVGQSSEDGRLLIQHGDVDLPTQLQNLFVEATQTLNPNKVKIVAGRQNTVDSYNRRIQRITNPQVTDDNLIRFGVGDLIIFNDNYQSGSKSILNAQEGQVIEVDPTIYTDNYEPGGRSIWFETKDSIGVNYYNVTVKLDSGEIVTVKIPVITDSNISNLFTLRHNAMTAAKQDRSKWKMYYSLKGEYAISLNDYKGTYKPLVSLGYAITAHKAQGSTYDVVAVDLDDIHSVAGGWTDIDKAKIIYTGLTRGSNISVVKDSRSRNITSPDVKEINDRLNLAKATKTSETKAVEHEQVHEELIQVLGGDGVAREEVREAIKVVQTGKTFEEVLAEQPAFFTPTEQLQIKSALGDRKLKVMSASRRTDPVFLANDIIKFLEENAKKDFTDPTRVNVIEIWSKHDGMPMRDILNACKKYRVAPIVSFSITGLGGTSLEKGVMKHTDLLPLIGELITAGTLNPATTTIRIDPILPGVTDMNVIKDIVKTAKSFGIKKYVTSMVQSYDGYGRGVVEGINAALASEGKTYDWEKYYGIQTRGSKKGKLNFKPKQEWIDAIGSILLEINADPEITLETCAFKVKGLKASACLDPLIIERLTGIDVMSQDGSYDRDTSRPECMCYGVHSDMFKYDHKCASSCAYCYAAHSEDSPFSYYDNNGNLIDSPLTRTRDKIVKRFRGSISADKFKLLQERVQSDLRNLRKGRSVVLNGQEVVATNARVIPGECITGRYHAKQYMMEQGDNISDIDVNFFARKLRSQYNIDEYKNNEYCSGVLFATNGENYMVKVASAEEIDEMLLKDPNVTLDKSIENIGGVYYKGDDIVTNAEGIKFCTVNVNGQLRNLILVEDSAFIGRLKNSSFFGFYRHVHNDDAKIDSEARWFNDEINTIAKEVYDSFVKQRLVIGTRIPTQAMPSFMPMEIIDFTDSDVNDEYVPTDLLSIQGADLDIDKEYTLDLAIDEIGKVYTFSKLSFVDYMIDDLLDIKLPNGREFELSNDPNALMITDVDLGTDSDSKEVKSKKWVALINKCMSAPAISYIGSNPKLMDQFLRDLNTHCTSKLSRYHKEQALKNKIAVSIKKVTMSIENQAIAQISVDTSMKALSRVAENSSLAEKQKSMSSNNPATKFVMQIQNMVGKQVIGVTAVSLKQFFARTAYWNNKINDFDKALEIFKQTISDNSISNESAVQAAVIGFINELCKINPITGQRTPLSNLNFRDLLDKVRSDKSLNVKFGIPRWTPDVTHFAGLKIEYVPYGSMKSADGSIVGARCDSKNKRVLIDLQAMQEKYESKAWTTSKYSNSLDIDFQSFEEWMTFAAYHELGHYTLGHRYDKVYIRNAFENEANAFAIDKILHLREVGDIAPYSFNGVFVKNFEELIIRLQKIADRTDASQLISALLSAATDNAKELILSKLNATTNFADIYTYLFSLGTDAEEVGKIMTSKQFSFIASIVNGNVFGVPAMKIQNAIDLYLMQGVVPNIDLNLYNLAFGVHSVGIDPQNTFDEKVKDLLQNEAEINKAILNIKSLMGKRPSEDDSGWLYDDQIRIMARDFVSQPVTWGEGTAMIKVLLLHKNILRARNSYQKDNNDAELIKLMNEVIPGVEEQKILGTLTGLNQGLRTQAYEKRKWIQNVENYINRQFPLRFDYDLRKEKEKEGLIDRNETFDEIRYETDPKYRVVWEDVVINPISFKFDRFLNDKTYQDEWIAKMDRVKVSDNILKIMTTVPHFAKMMDAWRVDNTLIKMNVARNNIENQIADKLKSWRTQSVSEAEWGQIKKYVNDVLIYNWITSQGFEFEYPKDGSYTYYDITGQLVPTTKPIQINSLTGIASFKQYMEQYLIPALKQKYGKYGIKRNAFIEALQLGATENYDGTINKYYKLPIPMMNIDSNASIEAQYNSFLMAFNDIAEYTINGWKIGDLFYLYNLIVHKDGFGQSSLTRIFEDLVSGDDNLLVNRYNKWLSQLDENAETAFDKLNMNLDDAKYRISKQIKSSQIKPENEKLTMIDDNFTLMLPSMIGIIQEPMRPFESKKTIVPSVKVSLMNDLIHNQTGTFALTKDDFNSDDAFISALQEAGVKNIGNFVKMREFAKEQRAFIFDGIVFLNSTKADVTDLIHEWAHIILAKMKWGTERERTGYYNIISSIVNHPKFNEIAERYKIDGKLFLHGSDLQEEVFVNLMQMYLQGRIFKGDTINTMFRAALQSSSDDFLGLVETLVEDHVEDADFASVLLDALEYGLKDPFKNDFIMQKHQDVANLKNKLVKENKLKWECNG